jgi:hypothetical protein
VAEVKEFSVADTICKWWSSNHLTVSISHSLYCIFLQTFAIRFSTSDIAKEFKEAFVAGQGEMTALMGGEDAKIPAEGADEVTAAIGSLAVTSNEKVETVHAHGHDEAAHGHGHDHSKCHDAHDHDAVTHGHGHEAATHAHAHDATHAHDDVKK